MSVLISESENKSALNRFSVLIWVHIFTLEITDDNMNLRIATKKLVDVSATLTLREGTSGAIARSVENQSKIFLNRYLNSLTIGDSVSISEIERQMKLSSELIMSVTVGNIKVDNKNIPNKDYRLSDDKSYMAAGTLSLFSVIMGA